LQNKLFFLSGFFFILISCSTSKDRFLNRNYHKVTTKYNVLFNGKESFKVGKKILEEIYEDDFFNLLSVEPIFLRGESIDNSTIIPGFQRAEEKSVKAIQKHSMNIKGYQKNRLIDDAYILLGKSRYFDRRFFQALESFNYIMENYSNPKTYLEARIWREKTNIRLNNNELAINNLRGISEKLINKSVFSGILNASLAQAYLNDKKLDSAKFFIKKAAINEKKYSYKVRYFYITGQLFEKLNKKDSAIWAYNKIKLMKRKISRKFYINSIVKLAILDENETLESKKNKIKRELKNYQNQELKHYLYSGLGKILNKNADDSLANEYYLLSQNSSKVDIYTKINNYNLKKPIIKNYIGAISAGVVNNKTILDLDYQEDSAAQVDANFVINDKNNSGRPDTNVVASLEDQFLEYEYTVDDLPLFTGFQVKVDISSTNQAKPAELLDFRAIAVA